MRLRTLASAAAFVAGLGLTAVAVATPAQAAEAPRHCVADVSAANTPVACYGSFTQAIAKATAGRVTDAPRSPRAAAADERFQARLDTLAPTDFRAASVVIGIEYWDDDYEGSSYIYTAAYGCDNDHSLADYEWYVNSLASGWNDEIESFRTYSNCWATHYWDINLGGPWYGPRQSFGDLEWMNDEASSITWG